MAKKERKKKPDYDRLSEIVQVGFKESELKILERMRRESDFPTNSAYTRHLVLESFGKKRQTELF